MRHLRHSPLASLIPVLLTPGCWSLSTCGNEVPVPAQIDDGDVVTVTKIVKGDEIVVTKDGREGKVRLLGVYAFAQEIADPVVARWRQASFDFLEAALVNQKVILTLGKTPIDSSGRALAYVRRGDDDINKKLLSKGLAVVYTEYGFSRESAYLDVEAAARSAKKNLWGESQPASIARGLREQWARFRVQRTDKAFSDRLLAEAANAPKAAPQAK